MRQRRRSLVLSSLCSGAIHVGLLTGLLLWNVPLRDSPSGDPVRTVLRASSDPRLDAHSRPVLPGSDGTVPGSRPVPPGDDVLADVRSTDGRLAEFTRRQLEQARQQSADRSSGEQMNDLTALASQLSQVSSQESLEQLTDTIAPWIGSGSPRATRPAETPDDQPFDATTAQVSDVLRSQSGESVQYVAVLVDAAGTTMQTPLEASDGETLFEVFQLMKQFPLLETIYRNSVMGLLDRLVDQEAAASDQQQQPAEQQDDGQQ